MRAPERMEALTGLRAFAALAVVFFHFRFVAFAPVGYATDYPITASLYLGVDLFFILSGFVLMHAHGAEFGRLELGTTLRFYALRLARIYPVHVAILFLVLAMLGGELVLSHGAPLGPDQAERFRPDGFFRHLFLVGWSSPTWNPPAWSLSAEWTAYLFFPVVAWAAVRLSIPAALAVLGALAVTFATVYAT